MRKRLFGLITAMMLLIGMTAVTVFADMSASYNTTGRTKVAEVTNYSTKKQQAFGRLVPTYGTAILELCNASGSQIKASDTYPVYPLHGNITCDIGANGGVISYWVRPGTGYTYVYGTLYYGINIVNT